MRKCESWSLPYVRELAELRGFPRDETRAAFCRRVVDDIRKSIAEEEQRSDFADSPLPKYAVVEGIVDARSANFDRGVRGRLRIPTGVNLDAILRETCYVDRSLTDLKRELASYVGTRHENVNDPIVLCVALADAKIADAVQRARFLDWSRHRVRPELERVARDALDVTVRPEMTNLEIAIMLSEALPREIQWNLNRNDADLRKWATLLNVPFDATTSVDELYRACAIQFLALSASRGLETEWLGLDRERQLDDSLESIDAVAKRLAKDTRPEALENYRGWLLGYGFAADAFSADQVVRTLACILFDDQFRRYMGLIVGDHEPYSAQISYSFDEYFAGNEWANERLPIPYARQELDRLGLNVTRWSDRDVDEFFASRPFNRNVRRVGQAVLKKVRNAFPVACMPISFPFKKFIAGVGCWNANDVLLELASYGIVPARDANEADVCLTLAAARYVNYIALMADVRPFGAPTATLTANFADYLRSHQACTSANRERCEAALRLRGVDARRWTPSDMNEYNAVLHFAGDVRTSTGRTFNTISEVASAFDVRLMEGRAEEGVGASSAERAVADLLARTDRPTTTTTTTTTTSEDDRTAKLEQAAQDAQLVGDVGGAAVLLVAAAESRESARTAKLVQAARDARSAGDVAGAAALLEAAAESAERANASTDERSWLNDVAIAAANIASASSSVSAVETLAQLESESEEKRKAYKPKYPSLVELERELSVEREMTPSPPPPTTERLYPSLVELERELSVEREMTTPPTTARLYPSLPTGELEEQELTRPPLSSSSQSPPTYFSLPTVVAAAAAAAAAEEALARPVVIVRARTSLRRGDRCRRKRSRRARFGSF